MQKQDKLLDWLLVKWQKHNTPKEKLQFFSEGDIW